MPRGGRLSSNKLPKQHTHAAPRSIHAHSSHQSSSSSSVPLLTQRLRFKDIERYNDLAERTCGCCKRIFETVQGLRSHFQQVPECRRWMKQKAPDLEMDVDEQAFTVGEALEEMDKERKTRRRKRARTSVGSEAEVAEGSLGHVQEMNEGDVDGPGVDVQDYNPEETTGDDVREAWEDFNDQYYRFIPTPPPPPPPLSTSPTPSTIDEPMDLDNDKDASPENDQANRVRATTSIRLDDDEDTRVVEESKTGGKVIRMGDVLYKRWKEHFERMDEERLSRQRLRAQRKAQREGDILDDEDATEKGVRNGWSPFASKLDWSIAKWAIEEGIGNGQLDRLLEIPGVRLLLLIARLNTYRDTLPGSRESGAVVSQCNHPAQACRLHAR